MILRTRKTLAVLAAAAMLMLLSATTVAAHDPFGEEAEQLKGRLYDGHVADPSPGGVPMQAITGGADCVDGMAADLFPCENVNLMSFLPLTDLESTFINDVWGWKDSRTKMELAIAGTIEGTVFVDVTDGENPVYLGLLGSELPGDFGNLWGDIRVYENTAYIGSEARNGAGGFGVQVVDLTQFRGATGPITIAKANQISDFTNSHNLALNEDSGRLYVVGATQFLEVCEVDEDAGGQPGGAIVYDVASDPLNPQFIGCLTEDGYTHDMQCVSYHGPDKTYRGHEICIGSNEDTLTVYDATDIDNPTILQRVEYQDFPFTPPGGGVPNFYTHQGWLSEKHDYFFLGDELDEFSSGFPRTTYIWDFNDLDDIRMISAYSDGSASIDHNMFVYRQRLYQANYTAGLTIYDTWLADMGALDLRGYFDVFPANSDPVFAGSWGTYPYLGNGKVLLTSSDEGLFVLDAKAAQNRSGGRGKG